VNTHLSTLLMCASFALCPSAAHAADPDRVEWSPDWPRVRPWEIAGTFSLIAADVAIQLWVPTPHTSRFADGNFLDEWARDTLKAPSIAAQRTASSWSDGLFYGSVLVPFVVDFYFGALSIHQNSDVAMQMLAIDLQSFAMAGFFTISAEKLGRERPYAQDCASDGTVRDRSGHVVHRCDVSVRQSFVSGHTVAATTAAGLVCVHHQHLPLFGGGAGDLAACLSMVGVAGATGVLRIVSDEHWATDVLLGWTIGAFSGYVLPSVLHYGFGSGRALAQARTANVQWLPTVMAVDGGGALIGAVGTF
jgi:membrane-associated phospholipid phosphatase